jgi:hypothetical protein
MGCLGASHNHGEQMIKLQPAATTHGASAFWAIAIEAQLARLQATVKGLSGEEAGIALNVSEPTN